MSSYCTYLVGSAGGGYCVVASRGSENRTIYRLNDDPMTAFRQNVSENIIRFAGLRGIGCAHAPPAMIAI